MKHRRPLPRHPRWNRIRRIRREINRGTYVTPERLEGTVEALIRRICGRSTAQDN